MLKIENLASGYRAMQVLWGPSLEVARGSITSLLGPNGVGKTTLLRTILGLIGPWNGKILYEQQDITYMPTHKKVGAGIVLVPEGRHLFIGMNVHQNLIMGAYLKEAMKRMDESLDLVYSLFPVLKDRVHQKAGSLSGGEQQMLTIARTLMGNPDLVLLDEPTEGLAPIMVMEVMKIVKELKEKGETILLVEQNSTLALSVSQRAYILENGHMVFSGLADDIIQNVELRQKYLGV